MYLKRECLHEQWDEEDAAEQAHAKDDRHNRRDTENAVLKQAWLDDGLTTAPF